MSDTFILYLFICAWIAGPIFVARYAKSRGLSFGLYLLIGFLFSPLISLLIILMIRKNELQRQKIRTGAAKPCPHCAKAHEIDEAFCRFCGHSLLQKSTGTGKPDRVDIY